MSARTVSVAAGLVLAAGLLSAQAPLSERIPITDPDRLAKLGFRRDAKEVYVWSGADPSDGRSAAAAAVRTPESWGTAPGGTTVMGYELAGAFGAFDFDWLKRELERTYCPFASGVYPTQEGVVQLEMPDGASMGQFQYWAYDEDPTYGLTFNLFESHARASASTRRRRRSLATADTFGSAGYYFGFKDLGGYQVNKGDCRYTVHVIFVPADVECRSDALQVQKVRVTWVRQVSPAPASPTFNDVATSHPFFRFIEALSKSGITGGCGGGAFCPDQPLTRGQMAVFLAKGLGLAWP